MKRTKSSIDGRQAFTLIELMVTIGLMAAVITLSVTAFRNVGEGTKMDVSLRSLRATTSLARQWAITNREETYVVFIHSSSSGSRVLDDMKMRAFGVFAQPAEGDIRQVQEWVYLPEGIIFRPTSLNALETKELPNVSGARVITFKRNGGLTTGASTKHVDFVQGTVSATGAPMETFTNITGRISVNGLTGLARVQRDI